MEFKENIPDLYIKPRKFTDFQTLIEDYCEFINSIENDNEHKLYYEFGGTNITVDLKKLYIVVYLIGEDRKHYTIDDYNELEYYFQENTPDVRNIERDWQEEEFMEMDDIEAEPDFGEKELKEIFVEEEPDLEEEVRPQEPSRLNNFMNKTIGESYNKNYRVISDGYNKIPDISYADKVYYSLLFWKTVLKFFAWVPLIGFVFVIYEVVTNKETILPTHKNIKLSTIYGTWITISSIMVVMIGGWYLMGIV